MAVNYSRINSKQTNKQGKLNVNTQNTKKLFTTGHDTIKISKNQILHI